jgi:hypothetical protein
MKPEGDNGARFTKEIFKGSVFVGNGAEPIVNNPQGGAVWDATDAFCCYYRIIWSLSVTF